VPFHLAHRAARTDVTWLAVALLGCACSASGDPGSSNYAYGGGAGTSHGGSAGAEVGGTGNLGGAGGTGDSGGIGGIGVGAVGGTGTDGGSGQCGDKLTAKVRDFRETHPDFEHFVGGGLQGIVEQQLGSDQKPVYAHPGATTQTTGPTEFAQWYRDEPGVNLPIPYEFQFTKQPNGSFLYDNQDFFPIDNQGFGNGPIAFLLPRNYLFTTEIHTKFSYKGGENFTFRGDDDLWVFVNGRLVIDLGGSHAPQEATADFDALAATIGLVRGSTYPMDIFHAERHTVGSTFRIETTIDCFTPVPPPS
jgi:fibro-slime domain-containing protein